MFKMTIDVKQEFILRKRRGQFRRNGVELSELKMILSRINVPMGRLTADRTQPQSQSRLHSATGGRGSHLEVGYAGGSTQGDQKVAT